MMANPQARCRLRFTRRAPPRITSRSLWGAAMSRFLPLLLAGLAATAARAEVVTKSVEYKHATTALEGVLVYDSAGAGKRPGVLLAHEQGASSTLARAKVLDAPCSCASSTPGRLPAPAES